jgi:hypothetical protein
VKGKKMENDLKNVWMRGLAQLENKAKEGKCTSEERIGSVRRK